MASPRSGSMASPTGEQQLVAQAALAATLELDPRLVVDARQRAGARALEPGLHRQRQVTERLERRDAPVAERPALSSRDPRDEAEVVVRATPGDAFGGPAADVAVLDGLRVGAGRRVGRGLVGRHRREEARLRAPVVRQVVVDPQPFDGPRAAPERDVHPRRSDALEPFEQVDVAADLEDRARLHVPGELRVGDLVVPGTPRRRTLRVVDAEQEVGVAAPGAVEERRLVDDVGAGRHRLDGRLGGGPELVAAVLDGPVEVDPDGVPALGLELGEVPRARARSRACG